ncbi:hypothetical protein [Aequorivita antarctica]|nr:hypothetical protein [Aequorivita antarctica]
MISQAQVGIGNTNPDASSALDIKSTTQGLLAPRMTSAQRLAITLPANSLLVYDTTLKSFYYYDLPSTTWVKINASTNQRNNYKLVKSVADLAPELVSGGGSKYLLQTNTLYEINGLITLAFPIDLNDAYVSGLDANEDILSFPGGTVFKGNIGGSIRNVTLKGAKAFEITGPGIATATSLLVQNTVVDGMTTSVGSISGIGLYFGNIVQFINNIAGITYTNIGNCLLNNQAWLATNSGTFETFSGTFGLIEKVSGFSSLNGSDVAMDVSSDPTVGSGVLLGTVFSGTTTAPSGYIKKYTSGSYTGFNFTKNWSVNSPGIPRESDDVATGNINLTASISTPVNTTLTGTGISSRKKLNGPTTSTDLFRFERSGNNRLIYKGNKKRFFQVNASLSFSTSFTGSPLVTTYVLYIAKGSGAGSASVIQETRVYGRLTTSTSEVIAVPILGTIELDTDDFIEVWAERESGNGNIESASLNATIN